MRFSLEKLRTGGGVRVTYQVEIPDAVGESDDGPPVGVYCEWWKQPADVIAYRITNSMTTPLRVFLTRKGIGSEEIGVVAPGETQVFQRSE